MEGVEERGKGRREEELNSQVGKDGGNGGGGKKGGWEESGIARGEKEGGNGKER